MHRLITFATSLVLVASIFALPAAQPVAAALYLWPCSTPGYQGGYWWTLHYTSTASGVTMAQSKFTARPLWGCTGLVSGYGDFIGVLGANIEDDSGHIAQVGYVYCRNPLGCPLADGTTMADGSYAWVYTNDSGGSIRFTPQPTFVYGRDYVAYVGKVLVSGFWQWKYQVTDVSTLSKWIEYRPFSWGLNATGTRAWFGVEGRNKGSVLGTPDADPRINFRNLYYTRNGTTYTPTPVCRTLGSGFPSWWHCTVSSGKLQPYGTAH